MAMLHKKKLSGKDDKWVWGNDEGTSFSTKSIRREITLKESVYSDAGSFWWNSWAPLKVNYHAWRVELNRVAAKVSLVNKGLQIPNSTWSRCGMAEESCNHIFFYCIWARSVWWNILRWMKIPILCNARSVWEIVAHVTAQVGSKRWRKTVHLVTLGCIWRLWLARNEKEFKGLMVPVNRIVEHIKEDKFLWIKHRAGGGALDWKNWQDFDISLLV
ncbi:uncharacterized protein LOC110892511 [Helianthus annuus]|uniref:uncharacterized protein LOC110892511 n=1 Tax=Helianthus annuus TaxID=4232 RepID=UPI000B8F55CB|nr:uncharacterized protein LOC110892511 [Helianthus annuus]